ncbi:hypothetical protein JL721_10512 [Aureococcus anophagefferens]|nr:hypothetical protein JL721_10512 [Aureococcus anophagefferens]
MLDTYPTSIAWMPNIGKGASDVFALSCADGTLRLMTGGGREEKKVAAHHGAALRVVWNFEGSALYSAGEDGEIKVWSKSGNLRSTLVKKDHPIYSFATGPGGDQVAFVCERKIHVEPVGERKNSTSWVAHDQVVLALDWNHVTGLLVSGAEDCKYKVWDHFGRQLYQSQPFAHVITAVAWSPNGAYFAVGAYNMLRLCDKTGWSCCRERPNSGSILCGNQPLVGAGGNGSVVFGNLVERKQEWNNYEATLVGQRQIQVQDVLNETYESLDFNRDRVVEMALGYGYLVVSTTTQCFVYSVSNFNTPYIFDSPETVSLIELAEKFFLVLTPSAITVYSYDGRKVRCCDVLTGKPMGDPIAHKAEVVYVALNQTPVTSGSVERQLIVIDRNAELFLHLVSTGKSYKLHTQVDTAAWNATSESLCAIADGRLLVWCYPAIAFTDRDLLPRTLTTRDGAEFGKLSTIVSFNASRITVRRADGAVVSAAVAPYAALLYTFGAAARWDESMRLCRFVEDEGCWCMLAAMAINARNLDVAEIALAAVEEVDKLQYATPPLLYRAIKMNIRLFRWDRALEIAVKHRSHVDTVLAYRAKHLEAFKKTETDERFKQLASSVQWSWDEVKAKKDLEKREAARHGKSYEPSSSSSAPRDEGKDDHK